VGSDVRTHGREVTFGPLSAQAKRESRWPERSAYLAGDVAEE